MCVNQFPGCGSQFIFSSLSVFEPGLRGDKLTVKYLPKIHIREDLLKPEILPHVDSQQQERTKEGKIFVGKKQTA